MADAAAFLRGYDGPPLKLMEVCGTHTAAIMKSGLRSFLSKRIRLVSGPGCPVCVTPTPYIDRCIDVAKTPGHVLACFGDMLKAPGALGRSLSDVAGRMGGAVRMVYSPFDVLALAAANPGIMYTVAAVGFETTAPAYALLMDEARARGLANIRLLPALRSAIAAIEHVCHIGEGVDAFICPGHVSVITGSAAYAPLAERYAKPFVVAGFEQRHVLLGVYEAARLAAEARRPGAKPCGSVVNLYPEAVSEHGNAKAQELISTRFRLTDAAWRGLGAIPASGYEPIAFPPVSATQRPYEPFDPSGPIIQYGGDDALPEGCRCGDVVMGRIDPPECPLFGTSCTPYSAVGPCMVSSEGACGHWWRGV